MSEAIRKVQAIEVCYFCDDCMEGKMKRDDERGVLMCNPPKYPHVCEVCGKRKNFFKSYPCIEFVDIEG